MNTQNQETVGGVSKVGTIKVYGWIADFPLITKVFKTVHERRRMMNEICTKAKVSVKCITIIFDEED